MKRKKGFSFLEVMAAMFVVSFGLVAVIELFATGLINSSMDRDRIVAAGLAQEGLEIVKNIRDNNLVIPGNLGFAGIFDGLDDDLCGLDYTDTLFDNSPPGRNCFSGSGNQTDKFPLTLGGSGFVNTTGTTKWMRAVHIVYNSGVASDLTDDSADVTSIVWWNWNGSWPDDLLDNDPPSGRPTSLADCRITAPTRTPVKPALGCVYATMHLDAWKP